MITNNFKKILTDIVFSSKNTSTQSPSVDAVNEHNLPTLLGLDGSTVKMGCGTSYDSYATQMMNGYINTLNHISTSGSENTLYLKVGTGTTAATEDDYELNTVNTDVSCDAVIVGISSNHTKTYTATFSNPTDSDVTVTEVGLYGNVMARNYGSPEYNKFLLDRTVLSTPITIPAGESKAITYELGF